MENHDAQAIKEKKRFLRRYRKNIECIQRLERRLVTLDEKIKAVRSPNFSGMPRGGEPVTVADLLSDKIELENRIERLKKKRSGLRVEILEEIDSLDDPRYCEVLECYFIDCLSLEDIADEEGYNVRHVYRLYSDAIKSLAFK